MSCDVCISNTFKSLYIYIFYSYIYIHQIIYMHMIYTACIYVFVISLFSIIMCIYISYSHLLRLNFDGLFVSWDFLEDVPIIPVPLLETCDFIWNFQGEKNTGKSQKKITELHSRKLTK